MNNHIPDQDLEALISHQGKPAVSIFLPTTRIPTRVQAESLQFRNLLREAEVQLERFDVRGPTIRAILEPGRQLVTDSEFWRHQKDGLAVYLSEDIFLPYQLPVRVEHEFVVGEAFHLKPLIPILNSEFVFYILAVSQNQVRLLRCTRFSVAEIEPATIPGSLQEILSQYEFEKQLQFHTSASVPGTGRRGAIFHGVGAGATEDEKAKIREFFDRINGGLREYFQDQGAPLIFAGVEYLFPIYREANTYPNLLESSITGNPEALHANQLQRQAWRLIEATFTAQQAAAIEQFHNAYAHGLAATKLAEVVPWADKGRVQTAFIDKQAIRWGEYDLEQFEAIIHEERVASSRDLTEMVAIYTLLRGGEVYLLSPEEMEMEFGPDNRHHSSNGFSPTTTGHPVVAAIYRFAV